MPILILGVLAIGFMVRFLVAMAAELGKPRKRARERSFPSLHSDSAIRPAGNLALGVIRITNALSSDSSHWNEKSVFDRHRIRIHARSRTTESPTGHRYEA
jgi:hypothetical protein